MILFSGGVLAGVYGLSGRYDSQTTHTDILGAVPHAAKPNINGPRNYLVLGTDSRDPTSNDGSRSDTMLIVHVDKGLDSAFIVSIPRDSYVQVPAGTGWKGGLNKINSAFAYRGPALAAKTVYNLTKIPLDGAMVINFGGVVDVVNAVGDHDPQLPAGAAKLEFSPPPVAGRQFNSAGQGHYDVVARTV